MSEDYVDWVDRLLKRCREVREMRVSTILGGHLTPEQYHELCGRVSEQDWFLEQLPQFMRGEDVRRPVREPLRSIEE
jgi:hypothetical protein